MNKRIEVTPDSSVTDCISDAFRFIVDGFINSGNAKSQDLSGVSYASPFFVAPVFGFIKQGKISYNFDRMPIALEDISFPYGIDTTDLSPLLLRSKLNTYKDKDFLPILSFPANFNKEFETSGVLSLIESTLFTQIGHLKPNITNGLRYVIGEIIDNVTQHSHSQNGYFLSNINRKKKYVEIAILDQGIGLLGSYNRRTDIEIVSDIEAIQAANRGISTKNLPYAENRGFGIITSKKMVIDGLKGIYAMISGKAMLLKTPDFNQYLELSPEIRINGTIVILRMPFVSDNFNYVSYIE